MSIGDKIKYLRKILTMTQKELGVAVGFDEKNANIRIAQYEARIRTPKPSLIDKFAKALNAYVLSLMKNLLNGKLIDYYLVVKTQNINGVIRNSFKQY